MYWSIDDEDQWRRQYEGPYLVTWIHVHVSMPAPPKVMKVIIHWQTSPAQALSWGHLWQNNHPSPLLPPPSCRLTLARRACSGHRCLQSLPELQWLDWVTRLVRVRWAGSSNFSLRVCSTNSDLTSANASIAASNKRVFLLCQVVNVFYLLKLLETFVENSNDN